jgi:YHS domain-containing protein
VRIILWAMCLILAVSVIADVHTASADPTTQPTTKPMISNKLCPVTKEAVDPKIQTVEYKGMTIGFCCEDCIKEFKADPDKYAANLK